MQLQRFADRQAARVMRNGAAFLSGATLSTTAAANTAMKGRFFGVFVAFLYGLSLLSATAPCLA